MPHLSKTTEYCYRSRKLCMEVLSMLWFAGDMAEKRSIKLNRGTDEWITLFQNYFSSGGRELIHSCSIHGLRCQVQPSTGDSSGCHSIMVHDTIWYSYCVPPHPHGWKKHNLRKQDMPNKPLLQELISSWGILGKVPCSRPLKCQMSLALFCILTWILFLCWDSQ